MFNLHTRIIGLVAVLTALVPASVADAKVHRYSATLTSSPLSTADGYPGVGGTAYLAGTVKSRQLGPGALIDRVTVTGQPWGANVFTFEGTEVVVFDQGTARSTFTGSSVVLEDGTQEIDVKGRVTGGTERFRGAHGRYSFRGTVPPGSSVLTGRSTGRMSY